MQASNEILFHVLLALLAIVTLGRLLGAMCRRLGQPAVIGEVIAGILLGPSLLGRFAPDAQSFLVPASATPYLGLLAQLGVILYMFLVGLEMNAEMLRARVRSAFVVSQVGIAVPFALGAALAIPLFATHAPAEVPFSSFALFLGISLAITAFPVLARILEDRGMTHTDLGSFALSCAALSDVAAWCLLAVVVGIAQNDVGSAGVTTGLTLAFAALMFVVVRPLARRWLETDDKAPVSANVVAVVLALLLLSALATEAIGVHALFGAFLFGAVLPHDAPVARALRHKLEDFVAILLLPAFFAFTGLRTQIGLLDSPHQWLLCLALIVIATLGKFGGTFVAARLTGMNNHQSTLLGALMNTRGLMELIVLNVGLDLGIISPTLYAMLVLMAIATTMMTAPLLHWFERLERARPLSPLASSTASVHAANGSNDLLHNGRLPP